MLSAVDLPQFCDLFIHEILPSHVERAGEVVDLLVLMQGVVDGFLDGSDRPEDSPDTVITLVVVATNSLYVTEAVIFKRVPHNLNVAIVQVEVVPTVLGLVWAD